ncbi:hypothetical protein BDV97DRAFT_348754 [Delphinella strobiligena]|nr:hypothetical protein BDV97DRAFT_348754 [Delphinella strobiligena]
MTVSLSGDSHDDGLHTHNRPKSYEHEVEHNDFEDGHGYEYEYDGNSDSTAEEDDDDNDDDDQLPPVHPVPDLQQAFEESIIEATEEVRYETMPTSATHPTAASRRQLLLEQDTFDNSWSARWNQRTSARCHPLMKLIAQIIFGMHLLHTHQAKSDAEVVKILQSHVDDIDGFLEKSTDDFNLAIEDTEERLSFLRLPMTHLDVFDIMLDDKPFRTQLVDGNDKIEAIIERTAKAMNASSSDVESGISAIQDLGRYLDRVGPDWPHDYSELAAILAAMRGNQEGWLGCFRDLQMKANQLGVVLVQLGTTIREMNSLAAAASRRSMVQKRVSVSPPRSRYASGVPHTRHSRHTSKHSIDKPLPQEPDLLQPAVQATLRQPRHESYPSNHQPSRESNRQAKAPPETSIAELSTSKMRPREPQSPRIAETNVMATFIKHSGPLESDASNASPNSLITRHSVLRPVNDSAYSSGSDPAAERSIQKRSNTPARFGLFPDSKPATPESLSRATSRVATPAPVDARIVPMAIQQPPHPHRFSIKRILSRKPRIQGLA